MRNNVPDDIGIIDDIKVESPIPVHPCLPAIKGFVVFLGSERRVTKIALEELHLFEECLLHREESLPERLLRSRQIVDFHRRRLVFAG